MEGCLLDPILDGHICMLRVVLVDSCRMGKQIALLVQVEISEATINQDAHAIKCLLNTHKSRLTKSYYKVLHLMSY